MDAPLLDIQNLGFTFGEGPLAKTILRDVSLQFRGGQVAIILGPSGSGKTTFLSLVGALRKVHHGSIRFAGRELAGASPDELTRVRRDVGFIFQAHNLISSLTACENVQLPCQFDLAETAVTGRAKALEVLHLVGLAEHVDKRPRQLSTGQQQRVAIARALVRHPKLILADEPTASLDKQTGRDVAELLQQLADRLKCAVLVVTHDHRILDIADRVLLLEDGRMEDLETRLERLLDGFAELFARLSPQLEAASQPGLARKGAALGGEFLQGLEVLEQQVSDLGHLRTRYGLSRRVETIHQMLGQLRLLQGVVARLGELLAFHLAPGLEALADRIYQALDALLLTAHEAFQDREPDQSASLQAMTQDRREVMSRIRDNHFQSRPGLSEDGKLFLFELTNTFSRAIYLLNSLATLLVQQPVKGGGSDIPIAPVPPGA